MREIFERMAFRLEELFKALTNKSESDKSLENTGSEEKVLVNETSSLREPALAAVSLSKKNPEAEDLFIQSTAFSNDRGSRGIITRIRMKIRKGTAISLIIGLPYTLANQRLGVIHFENHTKMARI